MMEDEDKEKRYIGLGITIDERLAVSVIDVKIGDYKGLEEWVNNINIYNDEDYNSVDMSPNKSNTEFSRDNPNIKVIYKYIADMWVQEESLGWHGEYLWNHVMFAVFEIKEENKKEVKRCFSYMKKKWIDYLFGETIPRLGTDSAKYSAVHFIVDDNYDDVHEDGLPYRYLEDLLENKFKAILEKEFGDSTNEISRNNDSDEALVNKIVEKVLKELEPHGHR